MVTINYEVSHQLCYCESAILMQHLTHVECHDMTKPCQTMTVDSFKLGKCFQYFWFLAIGVSIIVFFSIERVKWKRRADTVDTSRAFYLRQLNSSAPSVQSLVPSQANSFLTQRLSPQVIWSEEHSSPVNDTFIYSVRLRKLLYLIFCLYTIVARCYRHATGSEYYRLSWPLDMAAT